MGMFANADWKSAMQAALAGYMSRQSPQVSSAIFGQLQQAQADKRQESMYQRKRQDDNADWQQQYDYKMAHPAPVNNDTSADYEYIKQQLGEDAAKRFLQTKTNPIVMTPYGPMPYSQVNPAAPTAPVGRLTPIDGGPASPAPGGFPGL